ncbi:slit3 protein-like, partial [Tropilaelaps mercedesae]
HRAPAEEEKLFDAFVSYSKKDEAFVAQILAPELECGSPPYRLCLHYRDLSMAGGYLSEAIQEAVESSRRTIVILSEHFLKSEWCRYEFKSAHYELLNNTSHKLIVIFLGRV